MKTIVSWHLPIKTASEGNSAENPFAKSKRHNKQKKRVKENFIIHKPIISLPCTVILTRIAPRELDGHDNLNMSFKWIVDAIADNLIPGLAPGRADGDKRITWLYAQKKGNVREYAVRIEIMTND